MTESAADIRQRVDNMIDTLRCQRDAAETRAETYYYAYTKALHRVEAAEAKLAAIQKFIDPDSGMAMGLNGERYFSEVDLRAILDGGGT